MNPLVFVFILRASCFVQVYTTYCLMQVLFYYSLVLVDNAHAEQYTYCRLRWMIPCAELAKQNERCEGMCGKS